MEYRPFNQIFQRQSIYIFTSIKTLDERFFEYAATNYHINIIGSKNFINASVKPTFHLTVKQIHKITTAIPNFTGMEYNTLRIP